MKLFSKKVVFFAAVALLSVPVGLWADALLTPGDFIIAIDEDSKLSASSYPAAENPPLAIDGNTATKYLNFAEENSGFIITPSSGPSIARSLVVTTANDAVERDPTSFALYGTNDAIASTDNSPGIGENWTLIAQGSLTLPDTRFAAGPVANFENAVSYTSYRLVFPTVKDAAAANSMQISEAALYDQPDAAGTNLFVAGSPILAVDLDFQWGGSPGGQGPSYAVDATFGQYANYGKVNSGLIVTPSVGLTILSSFQITTATDTPEGDPTAWSLFGTTDPITSADNSQGKEENWVLLASGTLDLPTERWTLASVVPVANTTAYKSYRMLFTALRDEATAQSMHIAEIQFDGTIVSTLPDQLLSPGDFIIAIDRDPSTCVSSYPGGENPSLAFDGNAGTKYLNFGQQNSGFIVTPSGGTSIVRSLQLTTANDAVERDPASFAVYGTDDAITSADNSWGDKENWTLIAEGTVTLPDARNTAGPIVNFENATSYTSYRIVFPTVNNAGSANSMQVSEVALFTQPDGAGNNVLVAGSPVLAVDLDVFPDSRYPGNEGPLNAIDRATAAKYLNFGKANSGFIVTPSIGTTTLSGFRIITANDWPERDPASWEVYGTNDTIVSTDNSRGDQENWTLIASGTVTLPTARYSSGPLVTFVNATDYTSYRMVFTALRNATATDSMQLSEIQFYGKIGAACPLPFADTDTDNDVDQIDFAVFQLCYTGTNVPATDRACRCFDRDKDTDVDSLDFSAFLSCVTGPMIPFDQESRPDCEP